MGRAISRIMADKVYTSAEFKRERDTFNSLCKDLERSEVKKWLAQILEILMAERAKDQRKNEHDKLDELIKKHEELIPNVQKTAVMVDLYWRCYAYGDELKPHIEFLDGIMLSSTRDIAPSCVENVDELIERQEKSLSQLDSKRNVVSDLIGKGKVILQNPDKPKFLEANVKRIEEGWDDTKKKAQDRLKLLNETKDTFIGYAENNETIANEFDIAEEEIKKVKKHFNLEAAVADLKKRQEIYNKSNDTINGLFDSINANYNCMAITIPEDKKKILTKEIKAVEAKLEVNGRFKETVQKIEELVDSLTKFDKNLETCSQKTELPEQWTSRKTLLPKLKSLRLMPQQNWNFFPKVTRFPLMHRPSRMSLPESQSMSWTLQRRPELSVTNTPTMSNSGPSTELVSRNSHLGWLEQRKPPVRDFPSQLILLKSRLLMRRFLHLTKTVSTTSRSSLLLKQLLSL